MAVVASDLPGFTATFEPETPIDFLVAVTVTMAGDRLRVTSKLISAGDGQIATLSRQSSTAPRSRKNATVLTLSPRAGSS